MRSTSRGIGVCLLGVSVMLCQSGCKRDVSETTAGIPADDHVAQAVEDAAPYQALVDDVNELMAHERHNEAVARLSQAMQDPGFEAQADEIFSFIIQALVQAGLFEDARQQVLEAAAGDPERAIHGVTTVLMSQPAESPEALAEALAWCDALLERTDNKALINRIWIHRGEMLLRSHDRDLLLASVRDVSALDDEGTAGVVLRISAFAVDEEARPHARAFLESFLDDQRPETGQVVVRGLIEINLFDAELDTVETLMREHRANVPDQRAAGYAIRLMRSHAAAGDGDAVNRIMAFITEQAEAWPRTLNQAGASWVRLAAESDDPSLFMDRIEAFAEANPNERNLVNAFSAGFYKVIQHENRTLRERATAFNQRLLESETLDSHTRRLLLMQQLDSAFYRDAFREALQILESGIPDQDAAWHEELKGKVSAHVALQENRPEEAVAAFRQHLESVKLWTEPLRDPETGHMVIKESVMGFNEKRIGDIYAGMPGRDGEAAEAYAKAREWYRQALNTLEAGTPEYAAAEAALKELDAQ